MPTMVQILNKTFYIYCFYPNNYNPFKKYVIPFKQNFINFNHLKPKYRNPIKPKTRKSFNEFIFIWKRKTHSKSGFLSLEDASLYEQNKKEELSFQHQYLKKYKITIDELFNEWIETEGKHLYQDNTIIDYRNRYNKHIKDRLGNIMVKDVNYSMIQNYFNKNVNIGLSTNYKLKKILNVLMNYAIKCEYCSMNYVPLIHVIGCDNSRYQDHKVYNENEFSYTTSTDAIQATSSNLITPTPSA